MPAAFFAAPALLPAPAEPPAPIEAPRAFSRRIGGWTIESAEVGYREGISACQKATDMPLPVD